MYMYCLYSDFKHIKLVHVIYENNWIVFVNLNLKDNDICWFAEINVQKLTIPLIVVVISVNV